LCAEDPTGFGGGDGKGGRVGTLRRGTSDFREAEIQDFGVAAPGDENVRGLDVAMDNLLGMRIRQAASGLARRFDAVEATDASAEQIVVRGGDHSLRSFPTHLERILSFAGY
jgi:hypothetical protein